MKDWAKFFFGSFFSNKITMEGARRSFGNAVLGLFLAIILIFAGVVGGHSLSFLAFYNNATEYKDFVDKSLKDAEIEIKDNTANSPYVYSSFDNTEEKRYFAVDTRDAINTYVKVDVVATRGEETKTYSDYLLLSTEDKKEWSPKISLSGEAVAYDESMLATMESYLDKVSDASNALFNADTATSYNELVQKGLSSEEYYLELYGIYAKSYYPLTDCGYTYVPTLWTYYTELAEREEEKDYLIILSTSCIGSFNSKEIRVDYNGYYTELEGFVADGSNGKTFIKKSFCGYGNVRSLVYLINLLQIIPYILIVWLGSALVMTGAGWACKIKEMKNFFNDLTLSGVYLFFSGVIAFLVAIIGSFFLSRAIAYSVCCITFYAVVVLRILILIIPEMIKQIKINRQEKEAKMIEEYNNSQK